MTQPTPSRFLLLSQERFSARTDRQRHITHLRPSKNAGT
ncbi:hypothetical protein CABS03_03006 [Colletotrichum abscissum]|uniref:Uncharacterized protein n=1 Tax=Colletotrichum abscissum TaxID=1671311 RepID=A0A9P9XJ74_9PEZI|nr:hypothetical protein CABS02_04202 [Colletotrichum abscissum]